MVSRRNAMVYMYTDALTRIRLAYMEQEDSCNEMEGGISAPTRQRGPNQRVDQTDFMGKHDTGALQYVLVMGVVPRIGGPQRIVFRIGVPFGIILTDFAATP